MAKKYGVGSIVDDFNFVTPWKGEKNFYAVSGGKKKVLFFLRYYGCNLTQLEFHHIAADYGKFREKGAEVYVATQSNTQILRPQIKEEEIPFEILCDPEGTIYRLFDIGYLHIGFFMRGLSGTPPRDPKFEKQLKEKLDEATALGIVHGVYEGCEQQLPAVFVVDENQKILFAHYSEDLTDLPTTDELMKYL
jgi:peroxiredoxin